MLSIAGIGLMHRSLDEPHASLLHRYWRLFGRVVLAVVYACLPLAKLTSTKTLAIHACLLFCLTAFETISKFGSLPSPEKIDIALGKTIAEDETDYDLTEELEEMGVNQIDVSEHELLDHERGEGEHASQKKLELISNQPDISAFPDDVGVEADLGQLRALKVGVRLDVLAVVKRMLTTAFLLRFRHLTAPAAPCIRVLMVEEIHRLNTFNHPTL